MKNKWITVKYEDIAPDKYEVNLKGKIRNKSTLKELKGNSPKNEKGYVRVTLQNIHGQRKKYSLHRIVMATFYGEDSREVNHIDGNKENNSIDNLEYNTRKENAHHAKIHKLYQSCDCHYKAKLTNKEVKKICEMMSNGKSNIEIMTFMKLNPNEYESIISKIRHRKCWTDISHEYKWDTDCVYKKYSKCDIIKMCECIHINNMSPSEIVPLFPQYPNTKKLKNLLKKIKQEKIYKTIITQVKRSTTIETKITK